MACRDDRVYTLTSGEHKPVQQSSEGRTSSSRRPSVGIAPGDKSVYVATADSARTVLALLKARKQFTLHTKEPITNLERLDLKGQRELYLF